MYNSIRQSTVITKTEVELLMITREVLMDYYLSIFTARIRRMREGTVFSLFISSHLAGGGDPIPGLGGYLMPGLDGGGTPSQVWMGGYPIPGLDGRVPHPRSGWEGTPSQVWMGDTPSQVWTGGTPSQVWTGCTWGTPHDWMGYPPSLLDGVPPPPPLDRAT